MRGLWRSLAALALAGCASTVSLDDLLREGLDNPRRRFHSHTEEEIRVSGIVVDFQRKERDLGMKLEMETVTWGNDSFMAMSETEGTLRPNIERWLYIDLRGQRGLPGYAQCQIWEEPDTAPTRGPAIGSRITVTGTFWRYEHTPTGLRAVLADCAVD